MFCTNCGKQIADDAKFCPSCGIATTKTAQPPFESDFTTNGATETPTTGPSVDKAAVQQNDAPASKRQKADSARNGIPDAEQSTGNSLETVIGKNSSYYLREFEKAESGEKCRFNWAAFFFSAFFCLYRKCGELFKKYFLIPIALVVAASVITAIGTATLSFAVMTVGGIISAAGSIWAFINCIRLGKNFNRLYYQHCKDLLTTGSRKQYGTSIISAVLLAVILVVLTSIVSVIATIGAFGGVSDAREDRVLLNGEYGIIDPALPEEYLYLNFKNGSLQLYYSDDPEDVISVNYEIFPSDTEGMYSLDIYVDAQAERERFFDFCQLDENEFAVYFSDLITDGTEGSAIMVPFTEEYGFGNSSLDTSSTDIADVPSAVGSVPSWCSGLYYGDDIYSTITFRDDGTSMFDISIYRLVDIENCVITASDENSIEFTGEFNIDVGSVSGTLSNWGNGDIELTITATDWDMLPVGTTMMFYYDYRDPNYISGNSAYDICGIYVLPEIPANRLAIWENDGTIFLAMTNRNETLATATLASWELDRVNDCTYFTTYTIGAEEEISGYYDPSVETLDFYGTSEDSLLSACSFNGTFFRQYID